MVLMSGIATPSLAALKRLAAQAGLADLEAAPAQVLEPALRTLRSRGDRGLKATMQFTYRNPERSTDPGRTVTDAQTILVGSSSYGVEPSGPAKPPSHLHGRVAYYAQHDPYTPLRRGLEVIAEQLRSAGYVATVVADSNALVDRNAAWLAGLGWYGKNTMVLNRRLGSWFVIGAVITDASYATSTSPVVDGCASCSACLDLCPTGALVAPGVLDAQRCIAWLVQAGEAIPVQHRNAVGDRIYGCDVCQDVCPVNKTVGYRDRGVLGPDVDADVESDNFGRWVDLQWVLTASDSELMAGLGHWYIAKRDPDVIRRTALVIVGNTADANDPQTVQILDPYLDHANPLLAEHARWAAEKLGLCPTKRHNCG